MGHDLSFPFNMVKRGWRAVYAPAARATEKMVPSIEGEFARKRRMMSHAWPIVLRGGLLDPRGYPPLYALMIARTACCATPRRSCTSSRSLDAPALGAAPSTRRAGAQLALLAAAALAAACAPGRCSSRATTC